MVVPSLPTVNIVTNTSQQISVTVEVARTKDEVTRGLMYRKHLPENSGMLFLMPSEEVQSFWMKNTLLPLDMIFIDSTMKIVGIVHNAQPGTLESRYVPHKSNYVLEVNGGFSKQRGISQGNTVTFKNIQQ